MQFVPGEPLHALLRRVGPLPPDQAMNLVAQAARALHQAHVNGIVHRDVKPGNLLIRPDGRLVLTDFGIARMHRGGPADRGRRHYRHAQLPRPGAGRRWADHPATDVYALGVVGLPVPHHEPSVRGRHAGTVALMHARNEPRPLPAAVPEPVRHVVMRALAKDPRQRWATAAEMAAAARRGRLRTSGAAVGAAVAHRRAIALVADQPVALPHARAGRAPRRGQSGRGAACGPGATALEPGRRGGGGCRDDAAVELGRGAGQLRPRHPGQPPAGIAVRVIRTARGRRPADNARHVRPDCHRYALRRRRPPAHPRPRRRPRPSRRPRRTAPVPTTARSPTS